MLNENLLWARTISPTGKTIKEPTAFGASLIFLAVFAAVLLIASLFGIQ